MSVSKGIRVLMIGPGEGVGGGIAALVDTILPTLEKRVALKYFSSVAYRPLKDSGKVTVRNIAIAFSQYIRFLIALVRFRPNIIHLHTSQGIAWLKDSLFVLVGKMVHCHVIIHMHGGNFDKIYDENPRLIQAYTRKILRLADAILSVSEEWKIRLTRIIPEEKIFPFRNCIDIHSFQSYASEDSKDGIQILFLGRIGQLKGGYDLIEAIHSLHLKRETFHVWMVGPEEKDGDRQKVNELLRKYELLDICELVGSVGRKKALQYFCQASIFVLPSYYEGLPMVVLEALAAGLPVIATPVGGIPEVVRDGFNGYLVPIGDVPALANKLATLISNSDLRKNMGKHGREIAEQELGMESYVDRMVDLYSAVTSISPMELAKQR